jgi:hypothetical protein
VPRAFVFLFNSVFQNHLKDAFVLLVKFVFHQTYFVLNCPR